MSLRLSASGLEGDSRTTLGRCAVLTDTVLRGLGQVMFQNNSYAGLLFLLGIAANSLLFAAAALVGTITATLAAIALGADRLPVRAGLFGFNGALVAIALCGFLAPVPLAWGFIVLASACSTPLTAALAAALRVWRLPVVTAPFLLIALGFLLAAARFARLEPAGQLPGLGLAAEVAGEGMVTGVAVAEGWLAGIGQVFFQGSALSGALFAAGLLVASGRAAAAALGGSLAGLLVAWGMGAAEPAIRAGAFGFNSALTAIALGSVFLSPGTPSALYALLGAIVTPFVAAACAAALEPLGLPAMTLPFVLTTWVFLSASRGFSRIEAAS